MKAGFFAAFTTFCGEVAMGQSFLPPDVAIAATGCRALPLRKVGNYVSGMQTSTRTPQKRRQPAKTNRRKSTPTLKERTTFWAVIASVVLALTSLLDAVCKLIGIVHEPKSSATPAKLPAYNTIVFVIEAPKPPDVTRRLKSK